jgi:hypothetical protein
MLLGAQSTRKLLETIACYLDGVNHIIGG